MYQKISRDAVSLIRCLVTRREDRLSSYSYKQNDSVISRHKNRRIAGHKDLYGKFVYTDDACDIKKHEFFSDVDWSNLHRMTAPSVPSVKSNTDTKYFDEESLSTDMDIHSNTSSEEEDDEDHGFRAHQLDGYGIDMNLKTRPRDRILRDVAYRRDAMKLRKQNAFLGYTYRRPPEARPAIRSIA